MEKVDGDSEQCSMSAAHGMKIIQCLISLHGNSVVT